MQRSLKEHCRAHIYMTGPACVKEQEAIASARARLPHRRSSPISGFARKKAFIALMQSDPSQLQKLHRSPQLTSGRDEGGTPQHSCDIAAREAHCKPQVCRWALSSDGQSEICGCFVVCCFVSLFELDCSRLYLRRAMRDANTLDA